MNIAIDVDGVLAEQVEPVLERVNERYGDQISDELGRPMDKADIKSWDEPIPGTGTNIKIEIESALKDPDFILSLPVIDGAQSAIDDLKSKGFEITIATSRGNASSKPTKEWLDGKSISYDEYISTNGSSKSVLDAETLVDDYPGNISEFIEGGRNGILFHQPWNSSYSPSNQPRSYRAKSWQHVNNILTELHS